MTETRRKRARGPAVELRLLLPPDAYKDITAIAKVSGLAASQYIRSIVLHHISRTYANIEKSHDKPE